MWERPDERRALFAEAVKGRFEYTLTPPRPNIWQGPTRLTKQDYFAAANARNTGLCYARGDYIFFVDDLSVLGSFWLDNAMHAAHSGYICLGAYRKVKNLVVEDGEIKSFDPMMEGGKDIGMDCRWSQGSDGGIVKTIPSNLYGCSFGAPVDAMLKINGQDEIFDGMGYEDVSSGYALHNNGYKLFYNRNVLTLEDGPAHFQGKPLLREDPGNSPMDASHTLYFGSAAFPAPSQFQFTGVLTNNSYKRSIGTKQDLRKLREHILSGGQFPVPTQPSNHFWTGVPLADLPQSK